MIKRLVFVARVVETNALKFTAARGFATQEKESAYAAKEREELELYKKGEYDSTSLQSLKGHKWHLWDPSHTRSMKTHKSDAEQRIFRIPVIFTQDDVVRCIGGTAIEKGHPQVYIKVNDRKPSTCKWCGLRFQKEAHHHHEHHHGETGAHGHH